MTSRIWKIKTTTSKSAILPFFPPSFHSVLKSNKNIKQGARAFSCEKDWQAASVKLHISLYFDALGKIIF